jgi:hypothetical protein
MTMVDAQRRLESVVEFKGHMQAFLEVKRELQKLKEYAERDHLMSHFDQGKVETRGQELLTRYFEARTSVARGMAEATEITDYFGVPSSTTA